MTSILYLKEFGWQNNELYQREYYKLFHIYKNDGLGAAYQASSAR